MTWVNFEVKHGFRLACEDVRPARAFVINAGTESYPSSEGVQAISVRGMAQELLAIQ